MDPIRLMGIREQVQRAEFFLAQAGSSSDARHKHWYLVASVYFARAAVEIILEATDNAVAREQVESALAEKLPNYSLMERIRIHDFHRFGLLQRAGTFLGGAVKLTANRGSVEIALPDSGLTTTVTGWSAVRKQRPLLTRGDEVFDDDGKKWLRLEFVVSEFVAALPRAVDFLEEL